MAITKVSISECGVNYNCEINGEGVGIPINDTEALKRFGITEWIDDGNTPEPYVAPEPHWIDKRLANIENGGYGSIGEQLDMLYWDKENGTNNWKKHIDKVKSDIPKA